MLFSRYDLIWFEIRAQVILDAHNRMIADAAESGAATASPSASIRMVQRVFTFPAITAIIRLCCTALLR